MIWAPEMGWRGKENVRMVRGKREKGGGRGMVEVLKRVHIYFV